MTLLPTVLSQKLEACLNTPIVNTTPISGGSINEAYLLQTQKGDFFLKYNQGNFAKALFEAEVSGLRTLAVKGGVETPKILSGDEAGAYSFLLMEYIEPGLRNTNFWENFGSSLAQLHQQSQDQFGFHQSNFIGRLPQRNNLHATWSEFYAAERILPQVKMAIDDHKLPLSVHSSFDRLCQKANDFFPQEPPALTHGDLWSGNFLVNQQQQLVLIDPAVSYAHREMDIAMTYLFGGFDQQFYRSYQLHYPLQPGFSNRLEWYQLYYLLVHVNLFGGAYTNQVLRIVKRFQ